ncbi:MAG: hypothetical protein H0W07_08260 [Chloroflexi bacterium]|nr:hypothetical protein [Chloroflexota bacterium]
MYLNIESGPLFGIFHGASPSMPPGTAVLICPPWGWDEVTTYRSRRAWAEHLADTGHPSLRIDLPGAGDSAGSPSDPARLGAWTEAIVAATTWLRDTTGARVAVIGLGLGGLIASLALADGAPIDDLVLWASPARGRSFLREQRAFAKFQSSGYGATGTADTTLPDGWLEVGGFVLSAETISAIERIEVGEAGFGGLQRAMLMARDGIPTDGRLHTALERGGVAVTVGSGTGWGAMCFNVEHYQPPLEVFGRVNAWLEAAPAALSPSAPPRKPAGPPTGDHGDFLVDGSRIRETPIGHDGTLEGSVGLLAEPWSEPRADLCAIFLNAGAIRRIGPNRMWVEAGRRWAARRVPTLRVDFVGIGDADGDAGVYVDVGRFYTPDLGEQVTAIIDALESRGVGQRFVLIGLCSGAYWAFNTAAADDRVVAAVLLNPRALVWDPALEAHRDARLARRAMQPYSWRRILRGEVKAARLLRIGRAMALQPWRGLLRIPGRLRHRRRADPQTVKLERTLDQLRDSRTRVVVAFSGDEAVRHELERDGIIARIDRWPNVVMEDLPARDHTVRPIAAQNAVHDLIDRELSALIE